MTKWFVTAVSIFVVANLFGLIYVESLQVLVLAALVLGILNAFVRPMLLLLTLPINILSLGFFTLVVNAFLLYAVAGLVPGFEITGFLRAFLAALLVSLMNAMTSFIIHKEPKITVVKVNGRGRSQGKEL
ncbi:MAG: phage holin family protein [Candidatus Zixiibacteriota bacterium]|nr:MAG: phage holin family protein [candidate division Zixibacteria bacterium]